MLRFFVYGAIGNEGLKTVKEKELLLKKMYNEQWILFFEHDPNYQACTIDLGAKNFSMQKKVVISE